MAIVPGLFNGLLMIWSALSSMELTFGKRPGHGRTCSERALVLLTMLARMPAAASSHTQ